MKILEIILEAKPDNLGQGLLDKIFAVYQKRDINDTTIPKFSNGLNIAEYMFKFSGPQKLIWTAKQYTIDQHFFLHDLENWKNIFDLFDMSDVRQRLDRRDINQYKSIDDLKSVILPLVQQRENMTAFDHILEAVDKFVQKGEAEWLYRGPNYSIYHPISFYSSNVLLDLYGGKKHVDVCTVTGKSHFNDHYSPNGYLIYTLTPENFYVAFINQSPQQNAEFSDKQNNHQYDLNTQVEMFRELYDIIAKAMHSATSLEVQLYMEPNRKKHYKLCQSAVKLNGLSILDVPDELINEEMVINAVKQNGEAIQYVSKKYITTEVCKQAIETRPGMIFNIPRSMVMANNMELLKFAISKDGWALTYLPEKNQTDELINIAMNSENLNLCAIPKHLRTFELCLKAVKNNPWNMEYVPRDLISPERIQILIQVRREAEKRLNIS